MVTDMIIALSTLRTPHASGASQRAIARELNLDRRKVKQIIDQAA
jgi:hypothetical protein